MATIGSLSVSIVAQTDRFVKGLHDAQTGLGRFVKKISTVHTAVVGLAATGFGYMIARTIEAGSALHDLSQKLNISTEALSALQYAAEQMGGSAESLQNALSVMSRTIGDAANGTGAAIAAFERLGLSFEQVISLPTEQQFLAIVDAINKLPTAAERASAAQDIFGRGAKDLTSIIQGGTDEIIRFSDEAARAGAIVSSDTAAALDEASDSIQRMKRQWEAMTQNIVAVAAPLITGAMFLVSETIRTMRLQWQLTQLAIVGGMELVGRGFLKMAELANTVLPQMFEFDTEYIEGAIDSFAAERKRLQERINVTRGTAGGPLQAPPESKEVAKNTSATNKKLDEQTAVLKQIQAQQPRLAPAGMR